MAACGSKTESGVYTGTLAEALENKIVINTDTGLKEFKTDDSTVYDLGNYEHMSLDDVVDVNYHSSLGKMHADKVILREHVQKELVFSGTVSGVTDSSVTVTGKSLTVSFVRNPNTTVKGNLSVGDEADVIYTGDLSEYPFATNITVTAEAKPAEDEAPAEDACKDEDPVTDEATEEAKDEETPADECGTAKDAAIVHDKAFYAGLYKAAEEVAPFIGKVSNPFAFDSAADIYKKALDKAGVVTDGIDPSAFGAMVSMLNRPAAIPQGAVEEDPLNKRLMGIKSN
jgi:hypothetical protein